MPPFEHLVSDADSGRTLKAVVTPAGDDLVIVIGGGSRPHVGSVVLAQPYPSTSNPGRISASVSVLTLPPHKEEPIARCIAEAVCTASGRTTVVTAGVHEDGLDREGIEVYLELARRMAGDLARNDN